MVYDKAKWIAAFQKAVKDLNTNAPTSGKVCAIATIRYIRDGLCDDIGDKTDDDKAQCATVRDCCNELLKAVSKDGASEGFASNASAAAKAAGFKGSTESVVDLSE